MTIIKLANETFAKINEAYETLKDTNSRIRYNNLLEQQKMQKEQEILLENELKKQKLKLEEMKRRQKIKMQAREQEIYRNKLLARREKAQSSRDLDNSNERVKNYSTLHGHEMPKLVETMMDYMGQRPYNLLNFTTSIFEENPIIENTFGPNSHQSYADQLFDDFFNN